MIRMGIALFVECSPIYCTPGELRVSCTPSVA